MKTPTIIIKALTDYFRWLVGGVATIVLVAGYLVALAPTITEVRTSQVTARKNAEAELKSQEDYAAALTQSNAKFAALLPTDRRKNIDDFIPSDPDWPGLILTVKNIVTQSRLTLDSITVGQGGQLAVAAGSAGSAAAAGKDSGSPSAQAATVSGVNLRTQDVAIAVSGGTSYDAFKSLLSRIESSQRLFDVISVNFSAGAADSTGGSQPGGGAAGWSLVLRTYYLPPR